MKIEPLGGQRFCVRLPTGQTVSVTVTPELMEIAKRVRAEIDASRAPAPGDLLRLLEHLERDEEIDRAGGTQ